MSTSTEPVAEIVWSSLDRTPIYDLEQWQREYDPRAAGELDRRLDDAFGPLQRPLTDECAAGICGNCWSDDCGCPCHPECRAARAEQ